MIHSALRHEASNVSKLSSIYFLKLWNTLAYMAKTSVLMTYLTPLATASPACSKLLG